MINVIGLGYIGLPTALMMATHGVEIVGTDYNKDLVATLNAGKTTFEEDGLDKLFVDAIKAGINLQPNIKLLIHILFRYPHHMINFQKKLMLAMWFPQLRASWKYVQKVQQ